jgi:hypothetical protein
MNFLTIRDNSRTAGRRRIGRVAAARLVEALDDHLARTGLGQKLQSALRPLNVGFGLENSRHARSGERQRSANTGHASPSLTASPWGVAR